MKIVFTFLIFFLSYSSFAQTELEKNYASDVCKCLTEKATNKDLTKDNFILCFKSALAPQEELIKVEALRLYGDTSYLSGYKLGEELSKKTMVSLVNDCDTYFHLVDTLRYSNYNQMDKDSLQKSFSEMNQSAETPNDKNFLLNRANAAFILKKYPLALVDIHDVLSEDSLNVRAMIIKAWIYEINGEFAAAKTWFEKAAKITKNVSINIMVEVVKRKERETKQSL
jgi:tetratricopeptide (TPR) repeat protein